MLKVFFKVGCVAVLAVMMSFPVWAADETSHNNNGVELLAGRGHGPGNGTGNGGSGPQDGTGNGPKWGDCLFPDADMADTPVILAKGGRGGGNGGGNGPGDGSGNGGRGPGDGSGNGSKSGTCINL